MPKPYETAKTSTGREKPSPSADFEIDVKRVVWDPEYRRAVLAELRRQARLENPPTQDAARERCRKDGGRRG